MSSALAAFKDASSSYNDLAEKSNSKRAAARALEAEFWLSGDFPSKAKITGKLDSLLSEYVSETKEAGERGRALLGYLRFFRESAMLAVSFDSLKKRFDQAVEAGRTVIPILEKQGELEKLAEALSLVVWLFASEAQVILEPDEFQRLGKSIRAFQDKLEAASREVGTPYALCQARKAAGHIAFDLDGDPARASAEYEAGKKLAIEVGDSLLLGRLQWWNSHAVYWLAGTEGDLLKRRNLLAKSLACATDAIRNLKIPFQTTELTAAHAKVADCYVELANLNSAHDEKKNLLRKAIEFASSGMKYESDTWAWTLAASALSRALKLLSTIEEPHQRVQLLEEALQISKKTVEAVDRLFPSFWNTVITRHNLALTRFELAKAEEEPARKNELLSQAADDLDSCLARGLKWDTNPGFVYRLAQYGETYGDVLYALFKQTKYHQVAGQAIKAYETSADRFENSKHFAASAPLRWKTSNVHDNLGEFYAASREFTKAAEDYKKGASEVPGSASIFEDLSGYMETWSNIEIARHHHIEGEYSLASKKYSTASSLLSGTRSWQHLALLFSARSLLESAEGLSREEKHTQAINEFQSAARRFHEATLELEKAPPSSTDGFEVNDWTDITSHRESYCLGRVELEEARAADKRGEKGQSARKFRVTSEIFRALAVKEGNPHDRGELQAMAEFCDAWGLMKDAEAKTSPQLYLDAAETFLKLGSSRTSEPIKRLALANGSVCKALAAGARFRQSRDLQFYTEIKKQLEAAADHYADAGFKKTALWTRASQRLFDALIFISNAESEPLPGKKTELYHVAEKHLELAAKLYGEAGFVTRKKELLEQAEQVREEKNVLLAPMEALSQIPTATGTSLSLIPRGRAEPRGFERFEEATVAGEVLIPYGEAPLGSSFTLELDIANVGKTAATLVKLEGTIPDGFQMEGTGISLGEESVLDLKGRRLEHLKTYQVKIPVKASRTGTFEFGPRLSYVDDQGNYRSYSFPTKTLAIIDVGQMQKPISLETGALASTPSLPEGFRFETTRAEEVFQLLVKEFLRDYMARRIYVDKAGWRSLMDLINETKIPRSALYGPGGRDGPVLNELQRRGLVETRIFPKERGRGGSVKKVRVAYDNEIVKRIVEQSVIQNK